MSKVKCPSPRMRRQPLHSRGVKEESPAHLSFDQIVEESDTSEFEDIKQDISEKEVDSSDNKIRLMKALKHSLLLISPVRSKIEGSHEVAGGRSALYRSPDLSCTADKSNQPSSHYGKRKLTRLSSLSSNREVSTINTIADVFTPAQQPQLRTADGQLLPASLLKQGHIMMRNGQKVLVLPPAVLQQHQEEQQDKSPQQEKPQKSLLLSSLTSPRKEGMMSPPKMDPMLASTTENLMYGGDSTPDKFELTTDYIQETQQPRLRTADGQLLPASLLKQGHMMRNGQKVLVLPPAVLQQHQEEQQDKSPQQEKPQKSLLLSSLTSPRKEGMVSPPKMDPMLASPTENLMHGGDSTPDKFELTTDYIQEKRKNGEIGQDQTSQAGSIGRGIVKIEKINKEILMEVERSNKNLGIRKQKMEDLVEKQTLDKKILAKKYKEELSLLEKNQRQEITTLQKTSAIENRDEQHYIASLKEHRDELVQELEKLTNDAGNSASSHERNKLEPITRSLECPVCMELMRPPTKIWMCRFTHIICEVCKDHLRAVGGNCPTCTTEPFIGRNYMAEDLARTVFNE